MQAEEHPDFGEVWVHRKGATRAFPGGHPALAGTIWQDTGHPVLIPGSNRDYSYILRPEAGAVKSGYSVNHGAGRRMSRGEAMRQLDQQKVDEQYRRDGILVNLDGRVPLDESAQCYKSCEEVVAAVVAAGLARVEHTLWPLASIKGNEEGAARARHRKHKGQDRSREKERDAERDPSFVVCSDRFDAEDEPQPRSTSWSRCGRRVPMRSPRRPRSTVTSWVTFTTLGFERFASPLARRTFPGLAPNRRFEVTAATTVVRMVLRL